MKYSNTALANAAALTIFNIRAEEAEIKNADGSTADTQPMKVSLTVRYSIEPSPKPRPAR
ncbi:hypothetical protein [Duganella aceris]|jgi:hypothetical protein|uniref:hypothetical protein n=1 Tax=Duganella aceris TaxID=2703883 RepID=UPI001A954893|nr:hypothetical protein [Duganella aceris]